MSDPHMPESASAIERQSALDLFLIGFLVLFLELACIRWFAANVIFLQFFTNVVLLATFLGLSCGCMAARSRRNWLRSFPLLMTLCFVAARLTLAGYSHWLGIAVDVGHQAAPQEVFFGAEYRDPDVAQFVVPIEAIAAFFFVFIAFAFVALGQALGRSLDAFADRIAGYSLNIGGSLAGIVAFSALSVLQAPPVAWFAVGFAGVGRLLWRQRALSWFRAAALCAGLAAVAAPTWPREPSETRWSPYYAVKFDKVSGEISVDTIGHQTIVPFANGGALYSLIHLVERESGGQPFEDVLVIGAGSGNDIAHALQYGVAKVDAVEIDPVLLDIGVHDNPDKPYQDPRVVGHLDDGRHFLRTTDNKYDLIVYALVDSLIQHSSYANLRLESFLFTEQAFADVRRALKPGGVFVMHNDFRQGWVVQRVSAMAEAAFGCPPIVLPLPYARTLRSSQPAGYTAIVAGCNARIGQVFKDAGYFWLNRSPAVDLAADDLTVRPPPAELEQPDLWQPIAPTTLVVDNAAATETVTDDWPFLYVSGRLVPDLTVRSSALLGALGLAMVALFRPKGRLNLNSRMFFLGAAFMLLEAKAVVQMALLFGSTWIVNSAVFFTALALVLLANLYALKTPNGRIAPHYAGLIAVLAVSVLAPIDGFLGGNAVWRYAAPCLLALGPMFFAGVIFARSLQDEVNPDQAIGANVAGSVIGGLCESFSTVLGFQHLLILAVGFYLLSIWAPSRRGTAS